MISAPFHWNSLVQAAEFSECVLSHQQVLSRQHPPSSDQHPQEPSAPASQLTGTGPSKTGRIQHSVSTGQLVSHQHTQLLSHEPGMVQYGGDNTVKNYVLSWISMCHCCLQGHACSKALLQQHPPVINYGY